MMDYEVKIRITSKELSAKDRIKIKDTTNAIRLDEATADGAIIISPDYFAVLDIHNEKSEDKDYTQIVLVDVAGNKYVTGSASFLTAFENIFDEMDDIDEEYQIEVYRRESKNYKGKSFITCSIV